MLQISKKAITSIQNQMETDDFVRITVQPGGCSGMTYEANIVTQKEKGDKVVYQQHDITVITDEASYPYIDDLEIDYSSDLISAGFRFNNRANESSCGCGGSFSVAAFPQINLEHASCDR